MDKCKNYLEIPEAERIKYFFGNASAPAERPKTANITVSIQEYERLVIQSGLLNMILNDTEYNHQGIVEAARITMTLLASQSGAGAAE